MFVVFDVGAIIAAMVFDKRYASHVIAVDWLVVAYALDTISIPVELLSFFLVAYMLNKTDREGIEKTNNFRKFSRNILKEDSESSSESVVEDEASIAIISGFTEVQDY